MIKNYPCAFTEWSGNSDDDLRKLWVVEARHPTKRQQIVHDCEPSVEKFRLDAVTKVVRKYGIFHLDSTQKCFDNEAVT